ncbi:Protein phosphatase 2C 2, partial [Lobulomyces angularis]
PKYVDEASGCTAVACVISDDWKITVANAGDSRIVLGSKTGEAIPLSFDHKPTNDIETKRITEAGGFVENGRVNGNLALSRAIGDFEFKKSTNLPPEQQVVTSNPDIIQRDLEEGDEFLVIACDGIWDCMSNQEVVDFVRYRITEKEGNLKEIAEDLMDYCLAPECDLGSIGCDNMTVIIVGLTRGKSVEEWVSEIAKKTELVSQVMKQKLKKQPLTPANYVEDSDSNVNGDVEEETNY